MRNMLLNFMADKTGGSKAVKKKKAILIDAHSTKNLNKVEEDDDLAKSGKSKSRKKKERSRKNKGNEAQPAQAKVEVQESQQLEVARSILKPAAPVR